MSYLTRSEMKDRVLRNAAHINRKYHRTEMHTVISDELGLSQTQRDACNSSGPNTLENEVDWANHELSRTSEGYLNQLGNGWYEITPLGLTTVKYEQALDQRERAIERLELAKAEVARAEAEHASAKAACDNAKRAYDDARTHAAGKRSGYRTPITTSKHNSKLATSLGNLTNLG